MIGLGNLHGLKPKKIWQTGLSCKKDIINVNFSRNLAFFHYIQRCIVVKSLIEFDKQYGNMVE